jgi:tetratricopeptide (TPR) repeat protein
MDRWSEPSKSSRTYRLRPVVVSLLAVSFLQLSCRPANSMHLLRRTFGMLPQNQSSTNAGDTAKADKQPASNTQDAAPEPKSTGTADLNTDTKQTQTVAGNESPKVEGEESDAASDSNRTARDSDANVSPATDSPLKEHTLSAFVAPHDAVISGESQEKAEQGELPESKARPIARHTELADTFFSRRDYTNALIEYQTVVKEDPNNFKAHFMLGKVLMGMSDFEEASSEFDKVIAIRQTSADAHLMKGEALRMLGKYEDAENEYKQTLKIDASNALAHAYLGECHRVAGGRRGGGVIECHKAIALDEHQVIPHLILAQCYLDSHRASAALEQYQIALQLDSKNAVARSRYGQALTSLGKWNEAVKEFRQAVELDANYAAGHEGLSWALANLNKMTEAVKEAKLAVRLSPNDPDSHSNLAWLYDKKGDYRDAVTEYRLALTLSPNNPRLHRALGLALSEDGDPNGAIAELLTTVRLAPRDQDAKLTLQALMQKRAGND